MSFHIHKELNNGRIWIPRFRKFKRFSGSTIVTEEEKFIWGEKMSGIHFTIFGRMISIWITWSMHKRKWLLTDGWGYW